MDTQPSTNSDDILTDDMLGGPIPFDPTDLEDMELDGMDAREFAMMVAESASSFLPPGSNRREFVDRYVAMVTPLLKFGGFERLTAGMTLGSLVDKSPWIGAIICSGATVLGLWICWPKTQPQQPQQPQQAEEVGEFA